MREPAFVRGISGGKICRSLRGKVSPRTGADAVRMQHQQIRPTFLETVEMENITRERECSTDFVEKSEKD